MKEVLNSFLLVLINMVIGFFFSDKSKKDNKNDVSSKKLEKYCKRFSYGSSQQLDLLENTYLSLSVNKLKKNNTV